eukprot:NODE_298_length_11435_cov_0.210303.p5 type:complete len:278 gc:universal NODE_298_length_11435_cov_0.210303:10389-11222(+)
MQKTPALRIKCSPYRELVAAAHGENFGIAGKGYCTVGERTLNFSNVCSEIEWSEDEERLFVFTGKGKLEIFDSNLNKIGEDNMNGEVVSCRWNYMQKQLFAVLLNDSWIIANPNGSKERYLLQGGNEIAWSPRDPYQLSISHIKGFNIYDIRQPQPAMAIEFDKCMGIDYNKYLNEIVISTVNKQVLVFDERQQKVRLAHPCHQLTIKSVKCSPFHADRLASCSYDLHTKYWSYSDQFNLIWDKKEHKEIISGLDFSLFNNFLYDCGWDGIIRKYDV